MRRKFDKTCSIFEWKIIRAQREIFTNFPHCRYRGNCRYFEKLPLDGVSLISNSRTGTTTKKFISGANDCYAFCKTWKPIRSLTTLFLNFSKILVVFYRLRSVYFSKKQRYRLARKAQALISDRWVQGRKNLSKLWIITKKKRIIIENERIENRCWANDSKTKWKKPRARGVGYYSGRCVARHSDKQCAKSPRFKTQRKSRAWLFQNQLAIFIHSVQKLSSRTIFMFFPSR